MQIIAHRGHWKINDEKNTLKALKKAFDCGYGIETDVRDFFGELVISHNIADIQCAKARELFEIYAMSNRKGQLALNVKADGIQDLIKELLEEFQITNYFLFDMSIPELVVTKKKYLKFYTRQSDIETQCVLYDDAEGVWLDSFYAEKWLTKDIIEKHLKNQKKISVISPEIHGFDKYYMWELLKTEKLSKSHLISICTDTPQEAEEYFND